MLASEPTFPKLFGQNTIHIEHGYRCNFRCSYCTVAGSPEQPRSFLEDNVDRLVTFLSDVAPSTICVTGGEPLIWKELGDAIARTPQHKWILWSNLSGVAKWLFSGNVKLVIASYHEGQVDPDRFVDNLKRLRDGGCRPFAKFIARPHQDFADAPLWERIIGEGIPAAFAPFEASILQHTPEWMHAICTSHLVSAMYSARFFRKGTKMRLCRGGTRDSFQINMDGTIGRCSHLSKMTTYDVDGRMVEHPASLDNPRFFDEPARCLPVTGCYCEPHHFSMMTMAGENQRWERYISDGVWIKPSVGELIDFVRGEEWDEEGLYSALMGHAPQATLRDKIEVLEAERRDFAQQMASVNTQMASLNTQMASLNTERDNLGEKLRALETKKRSALGSMVAGVARRLKPHVPHRVA